MSRFVVTKKLPAVDLLYIAEKTTEYLLAQGFKSVQYKGDTYYKKNGTWIDPPQYIKFGFKTGEMNIEAFIKFPLMPGVGVGEMGIEGSFCEVKKTLLVRSVNNLIFNTQRIVKLFLKEQPEIKVYPEVQCTLS